MDASTTNSDVPSRLEERAGASDTRPRVSAVAFYGALLIFAAAALLRFAGLEDVPAGLFRDEAEKGYNAWAIATAGGAVEFSAGAGGQAVIGWNAWPYVIDVMGVKTSALYQYVSVPFVKAFGLTVASTRMAAALAGTLAVVALGALLLRIWPAGAALGAMAWLALCPWHLVFSRWALQGIFVPLGMMGVLAGAAGAERDRHWGFPLAGAALGFMFYAYSGAQPFVLAWAVALVGLYGRAIARRPGWFALGVGLLLLGAAPRAWIIVAGDGGTRLGAVAVWNEQGATAASAFAQFVKNYVAHFNPVFLFFDGDALPRHGYPGFGQLLMIDALLLPIGLVAMFRRKMPLRGALLAAFLLGPVGAAITRTGIPHALRSLPMVVPAAAWGGVGLAVLTHWIVASVERTGKSDASKRAAARRRGQVLAGMAVLAAALFALRVHAIAWKVYRESDEARVAFAASEREAFEKVMAERASDEAVWVSGAILYAPYFAMFYGELPPREVALDGLDGQGVQIFPPAGGAAAQAFKAMAPGDRMIDFNPVTGEARVARKMASSGARAGT